MKRRFAPLALIASMLLVVGACSKTENANTTAGSQAPATTASKSSDTTKSSGGDTDTTKKTTETTGKSTGTTTKKSGSSGANFTAEQQSCITEAARQIATSNPDAAQALAGAEKNMTPEVAGVIGGLIVGCVPKTELVSSLIEGLKSSEDGKNLSDSDVSCIKDQVLALDSGDLAVFVGILIYSSSQEDKSALAPTISKLNKACNTSLPA